MPTRRHWRSWPGTWPEPARQPSTIEGRPRTTPNSIQRMCLDEADDGSGKLWAGILLQEVAGAGDHRMRYSLCTRHIASKDRRHWSGDRIAVAEGHQHRSG